MYKRSALEGATSSRIMKKWEKNEELSFVKWKQEKEGAARSQDKVFL